MATPYDWLLAYVPGGRMVERVVQTGEREGAPIYNTVYEPLLSWSDYATKVYDGEGNVIGENPWWFQQTQYILSPNDWAAQKSVQQWGVSLDPNGYEWVILGEYAMPGRREWIFELLKSAGDAAGVPADYDWTPGLVYGAQDWWQHNEPLRWLETPAVFPVHMALAYASREFPALMPFVQQTGPGSAIWEQSLAEAHARRDAHKAVHRSMNLMIAAALTAGAAAAYFAPAAAGAGAGEAGAAAGVAAGGTATVQGAELAALIEAGTVGTEGAFLEAAALSGATVEYSTATGALLSATMPSGAVVAFDAAADPFAQMGVQEVAQAAPAQAAAEIPPELGEEIAAGLESAQAESAVQNAALAEISGDVAPGTLASQIGDEAAAQYLADAAQTLGPASSAAASYMQEAGQALVGKLVQMGKQKLATELTQAFGGGAAQPIAAPAGTSYSPEYGYDYGGAGELDLTPHLQPTTISGKLIAAAKPLGLGAGLGILALAILGGDER